jgi:hypothetical protein
MNLIMKLYGGPGDGISQEIENAEIPPIANFQEVFLCVNCWNLHSVHDTASVYRLLRVRSGRVCYYTHEPDFYPSESYPSFTWLPLG